MKTFFVVMVALGGGVVLKIISDAYLSASNDWALLVFAIVAATIGYINGAITGS